ncbi:MAG: SIR2 family protein [Methylococcaceae bacterium]|nr:SIR2 family protein [Methylococcaceae bacterium]MDP3905287.1 SIR2 family protein [Methylococcaceae bacterium]
MNDFESLIENLNQHLNSNRQSWLFGAGISCDANIPLMYPLTARVNTIITEAGNNKNIEIYKALSSNLKTDAHVEQYLSHLGDLIALAERSKDKCASINNENFDQKELRSLHSAIVEAIGITVRYGYKKNGATEIIGSLDKPIVDIASHISFLKALFRTRVNLTSRSNITFFTTNYDTLLEDAMALEKIMVIDGFSGGAMGVWNPNKEFNSEITSPNQYNLYKLHGSVDWHRNDEYGLVRARYGTNYLSDLSEIMIYPQATKYVETQKDPFASLFTQFRSVLNSSEPNVFITCGYSFGDDHINSEIETALKSLSNKTNIVAFFQEDPKDGITINKTLDAWLLNPKFGKRVFVAGKNGLYNNSLLPVNVHSVKELSWWKFSGLTEFLKTGEAE